MFKETPKLPEPFVTDYYDNNNNWFKWFIVLLIVGSAIVFFIAYGKTTTQGWEAASVRDCMNNNPNLIVQIDRNLFSRYCEMEEGVGVQVLERDEKGAYHELRARIEHTIRNFESVRVESIKNGWRILSKLP